MHGIATMNTSVDRKSSPASMMAIESVKHRTAAKEHARMPARIDVEEESWSVYNPVCPAVRTVYNGVSRPRGVHNKVVKNLSRGVIVEVNSNNLIGAISFDSELWVAVSLIVGVFEECAELSIPLRS
jgi:hypothetical protein